MLALHHLAVAISLAGFYLLAAAAGVVELQAELWGGGQVRAGQGREGKAAGWALQEAQRGLDDRQDQSSDKQQHTHPLASCGRGRGRQRVHGPWRETEVTLTSQEGVLGMASPP